MDLLLLDDWGLAPLTESQQRYLLELAEDRHNLKSTLITSQMPVDHRHELIGDPMLANTILDQLIHNAHRPPLKRLLQKDLKRREPRRAQRRAFVAFVFFVVQGFYAFCDNL